MCICKILSKGLIRLSAELRISIQGKNPPDWAIGHQSGSYLSYYENEHREQWVAKLQEGILLISGLEIDWEVIELNIEQAISENDRIIDQIVAGTLLQTGKKHEKGTGEDFIASLTANLQGGYGRMPLLHIMFGFGELLWLASVFNAVIPKMK